MSIHGEVRRCTPLLIWLCHHLAFLNMANTVRRPDMM